MSLRTRVEAGFARVAAEINTLRGEIPAGGGTDTRNLPAYAGSPLDGPYDAARFVHNGRTELLARARAGLARAADGSGSLNMVCVGDSSIVGTNGTTMRESQSIPYHCAVALGRLSGAKVGGGAQAFPPASSTKNDRWSHTGSVVYSTVFAQVPAGQSITYESENCGEEVVLYYGSASGTFNRSIDGAANVLVTPTGGPVLDVTTITGLNDSTHKVTLTAVSGTVYVGAIQVRHTGKGINVHNLGYGGSRAAHGTDNQTWTTGGNGVGSLRFWRNLLVQALGTPDVVFVSIGPNDLLGGDTALNAIDGIRTLREDWFPSSDFIMSLSPDFPTVSGTLSDAYAEAKYALAEELDAVLIDWRAMLESHAIADTRGLVGADDAHLVWGFASEAGRHLADVISGASAATGAREHRPVNYQTGTAYTLREVDDRRLIKHSNTGASTITVPTGLPVGFECQVQRYGTGSLTIAGAGNTFRSTLGLVVNNQYGIVTIRVIGTDEIAVSGDLADNVVTWATGAEPSLTGVPDGTIWVEYTP